MRILFLTSRLPFPPNRGDRSRVYNFIKHLSQEHEIDLISFIAGRAESDHADALRRYCGQVETVHLSPQRSALGVAGNLWRPLPLQALYYRSGPMGRLIDSTLAARRYDVVYVHLFRMAAYVAHHDDVYRIVDLTDVISKEIRRSMPYRGLASRLLYSVERPRIERYERQVAQSFEETWLISEHDRQTLAASCPQANIQVVPIGIDRQVFAPTGQAAVPDSLVFVGHLQVYHNVDAVTQLAWRILPMVQQQLPNCRLTIVGAEPGPQIQALAQNPAVTVTGFVPDLNQYLNQAAVFAAPLRFAAGVQTKVVEAMAAARPVVTSSMVCQGLGAEPGRDLLVADDAETMARQIVMLLRDDDLRSRIGQAGLAFVSQHYTWDHVVQRMREVEQGLR